MLSLNEIFSLFLHFNSINCRACGQGFFKVKFGNIRASNIQNWAYVNFLDGCEYLVSNNAVGYAKGH